MRNPTLNNTGNCPVCGAAVVEGKIAGIWSGNAQRPGGLGYSAVCKKCNTELESFPTQEEADAGLFFWGVREPRIRFRQYPEDRAEQEVILTPLLQAHADREQVIRSLGFKFTDYSIGSRDHSELRKWLFFEEVNEAAGRYPGILFHMNATTMTWLFFDSGNRLQHYFIRTA